MQARSEPPAHRQQLLIGEERKLKSNSEKATDWEVVGWFISFYEGDKWVNKTKHTLTERRYRLVERTDPKWGRATLKGQLKPLEPK